MVKTSGSTAQTFLTFAIVDELIRTLCDAGIVSRDQVVGIIGRTIANIEGQTPSPYAAEAVRVAQEMLNEYR